ncbi:uncharacterized protein (TIGR02680 family) [Thermosediminibacter litoriperuensis]|uniref:Uncharacterized protein (TIGR02680 family) n=2 Tax=Thermosediminibacter litoriperuensis TaxID=291989 RepID=A0A5S5AZG6_9FIRM|nr:uncharacterized protein (TIGR02680 family) [Thermosediminibacter litoriperuensis]
MINRVGLLNFWYYDEEVFEFAGGRLLLRGSNGAGKSVTMQSFIPLLLDGNRSPERLDPFGSRARKLEDYLLGEEEINGLDERTGYLFMEFKREEVENYITTGMGLRARRGQGLDIWYFIILDGRRIGVDFFLYKYEVGEEGQREKVPLSKRELKNRIGSGGEVVESQRDYMELVNRYLFGFDNLEEYEDLIKILLYLRSPKLSKDFKPSTIYGILMDSLPALSDDDLRPLSETIENMDLIKLRLEDLKRSQKALSKIKGEYDDYNRFMLYEKANMFLKSHSNLSDLRKSKWSLEAELEEHRDNLLKFHDWLKLLEEEEKALRKKEESLRESDAFKIKKEIVDKERDLRELLKAKDEKEVILSRKERDIRNLEDKIAKAQEEKCCFENIIHNDQEILDELSKEIDFVEHSFFAGDLNSAFGRGFDFSQWEALARGHREKIKKVSELLKRERDVTEKYQKALKDREDLEKRRGDLERQLKNWGEIFEGAKTEYVEKIYDWSDKNEELKLERQELESIARLVLRYGEEGGFDEILSEVRHAYDKNYGVLQEELHFLKNEKKQMEQSYSEKAEELSEWRSKKEPEPERSEQVERNRKRLAELGIPHIPFYKAVEFREEIDEETRGLIEAALEEMGILDALIVPKEYLKQAMAMDKDSSDKFIMPGEFSMKLDLFQYFRVSLPEDNGELAGAVDEAMRNITVFEEKGQTFVTGDGYFGIGALRGKAAGGVASRFIGFEARKRYREEIIRALNEELEAIRQKIQEVESRIKGVEKRIENLKEDYRSFPADKDLRAALETLKDVKLRLDRVEEDLSEQKKIVSDLFDSLQKAKAEAREAASGLRIRHNLESFRAAEEKAYRYLDALSDLDKNYSKFLSIKGNIDLMVERAQEARRDAENLEVELQGIKERIRTMEVEIRALQDALDALGIREIQAELESCIERLSAIPREIRDVSSRISKTEARIENISAELEKLKGEISLAERVFDKYREGLQKELELGFVREVGDTGTIAGSEEDQVKTSREIILKLRNRIEKIGQDKEKITQRLQDAFHINVNQLLNYGLSMSYLFDEETQNLTEHEAEAVRRLRRLQITANLRGKSVSIYALFETVEQEIAINESLLRETDRKLFEEIMLQNVGAKIRAKIFRAEDWVKNMNRLMAERDTSSGITFSLAWKPLPAETDEEMDTRELVEILKSGVQMLKPEDFERVTRHFRSKVEAAKKIAEGPAAETFHRIIKEVLDYRRWFEFRLYYKKEGESRKELTDSAFNRLSGGEKAMAMYIPLFSAVYARYEAARSDAPRVISLDEAFAGVDDNNIRDMFKLMEDLRFNYIINSQVLWGDYDTVPQLSICELLRPKNSNCVTVIRYLWDGEKRILLLNALDEAAASEQRGELN